MNRPTATTPCAPRRPAHILLVDDEPRLVELWSKMLTECGYVVTGCTDVIEALALFRRTPCLFDVVITDQAMPKISGSTLSREIWTWRPDTPIFLCTGFRGTLTEATALQQGFSRLFFKPVRLAELTAAIETVLTNRGQ